MSWYFRICIIFGMTLVCSLNAFQMRLGVSGVCRYGPPRLCLCLCLWHNFWANTFSRTVKFEILYTLWWDFHIINEYCFHHVPVGFVPPPPLLRSPKGGCCSISDDLSCFWSSFLNFFLLFVQLIDNRNFIYYTWFLCDEPFLMFSYVLSAWLNCDIWPVLLKRHKRNQLM